MRRFLLTSLMAFLIQFAGAQSLQVYWPGGALVNNQNIEFWGGDTTINYPLYVSNISATDVSIWVRKTYISMIPNTQNYFCWGQCQPEENMVSSVAVLIPALTTDSLNFLGHYIPDGNPGTSVIRYTFFSDVNPLDSFCVNVVVHAMTGLGIVHENNDALLRIFPNPATDFFEVEMVSASPAVGDLRLSLYHVSGILVREQLFHHRERVHVDAGDLSPGIYLCVIRSGDLDPVVEKIIIR